VRRKQTQETADLLLRARQWLRMYASAEQLEARAALKTAIHAFVAKVADEHPDPNSQSKCNWWVELVDLLFTPVAQQETAHLNAAKRQQRLEAAIAAGRKPRPSAEAIAKIARDTAALGIPLIIRNGQAMFVFTGDPEAAQQPDTSVAG